MTDPRIDDPRIEAARNAASAAEWDAAHVGEADWLPGEQFSGAAARLEALAREFAAGSETAVRAARELSRLANSIGKALEALSALRSRAESEAERAAREAREHARWLAGGQVR